MTERIDQAAISAAEECNNMAAAMIQQGRIDEARHRIDEARQWIAIAEYDRDAIERHFDDADETADAGMWIAEAGQSMTIDTSQQDQDWDEAAEFASWMNAMERGSEIW